MNKYEQDVQGYAQAAGKQALKAMLFFFVGLPAVLISIAIVGSVLF
jgi:hypothetical protein